MRSPSIYNSLEDRVLLLTLIPGMGAQALEQLKDSYRAVILQSFGVGGLPGGGNGRWPGLWGSGWRRDAPLS